MQTIRQQLSDLRERITETEDRLAQLKRSGAGSRMTELLIESATTTLKLMQDHEAWLESQLVPATASARGH